MNVKLIAIGSRIMTDDGIGPLVAESLRKKLVDRVQIVIGETDTEYCISQMEGSDYIIVLDASHLGVEPGTVWRASLEDTEKWLSNIKTQHDMSFLQYLTRNRKSLRGFIIGIEVWKVELGFAISDVLRNKFTDICNMVEKEIKDILEEIKGA